MHYIPDIPYIICLEYLIYLVSLYTLYTLIHLLHYIQYIHYIHCIRYIRYIHIISTYCKYIYIYTDIVNRYVYICRKKVLRKRLEQRFRPGHVSAFGLLVPRVCQDP